MTSHAGWRAVVRGLGADLLGSEFHSPQDMELVLRGRINTPLDVLRSPTSVNAELLLRNSLASFILLFV